MSRNSSLWMSRNSTNICILRQLAAHSLWLVESCYAVPVPLLHAGLVHMWSRCSNTTFLPWYCLEVFNPLAVSLRVTPLVVR